MENFKYDVPVAIIFFNRPACLKKVFEAVANARPSRLFLIQDGARKNRPNDVENIKKCREIVENVNWDCKVTKIYSDENLGCGGRMSSGITEAFKTVDRLIILEDDCVPCESMFSFCEEMLEKYKDDTRINMISGMNHLDTYNCGNADYFFCKTGAIWGWATWKRVWDLYEYGMDFVKDNYAMRCFKNSVVPSVEKNRLEKTRKKRYEAYTKGQRLTAWTYQFSMLRHLYSQIVIVPRVNLVSNIGTGVEATHGKSEFRHEPKQTRRILQMKTSEMNKPFKHPKYVICDADFDREVWKIMGYSWYRKLARKIERKFLEVFVK